ncbi:hypothetical protein ANN_11159, partial [Periplaneta americana]
ELRMQDDNLEIGLNIVTKMEADDAKKRQDTDITYGIDDNPPWYLCVFMALQHYLTMIGAIVSIPFILTPAICMKDDDPARSHIICTMIFVTGIVTWVQATFGCRLPIVQGGTISFLVPTLAILNLPQWRCPEPAVLDAMTSDNRTELWQTRMRELSGAIAVSAVLQAVIGLFGIVGVILRYVTPLTIVPTVSLVGLSLFENAADSASQHWGIAAGTILMLTAFSQLLREVHVPLLAYKRDVGFSIVWFQLFKLFPVSYLSSRNLNSYLHVIYRYNIIQNIINLKYSNQNKDHDKDHDHDKEYEKQNKNRNEDRDKGSKGPGMDHNKGKDKDHDKDHHKHNKDHDKDYDKHINTRTMRKTRTTIRVIAYHDIEALVNVLLTIIIMWGVCALLTLSGNLPVGHPARTDVKLRIIEDSPWFRFPYPGQWGVPTVTAAGVLGMLAGVLACTVESISYYPTTARMCGAPPPPVHAINRGIAIEGIGTILAGLWGSGNGTNTFGENVGAIGVTKIGSRRVIQYAAVLMIIQGLISKFGAAFIIIPQPVVGGMFCIMFGMITAFGKLFLVLHASLCMEKWHTSHATYYPYDLEGTQNHSSDCYFCLTNIKGITSKSKHTVVYPNLQSAMRPVPHCEELLIPKPPEHVALDEESSDSDGSKEEKETEFGDTTFEQSCSSELHLLSQEDLNDLIRDLKLSKTQSEMLASRLNG